MVRQDIVASLRNALERGQDINRARQSLINAGYSPKEVQQAEAYLTGGMVDVQYPQPREQPQPQTQPQEQPQEQPQTQTQPQEHPQPQPQEQPLPQTQPQPRPLPQPQEPKSSSRNSSTAGLIILIIILFLLIGTTIVAFLAREQLLEFIESLIR